jgi:hypothetical protein
MKLSGKHLKNNLKIRRLLSDQAKLRSRFLCVAFSAD